MIVDAYQRATQVMTVMTVLAYQMVTAYSIIVVFVMLTAQMTVYRIVLVNGVDLKSICIIIQMQMVMVWDQETPQIFVVRMLLKDG